MSYIVKLTDNEKIITGLITNILIDNNFIKKVTTHEKVSLKKVNQLIENFLAFGIQRIPITLGVANGIFDDFLTKNNGGKELCSDDVNDLITYLSSFIILDGHHRFEAVRKLYDSGLNPSVNFCIVPFYEMHITGFLKVFAYMDMNVIINLLDEIYEISRSKLNEGVYKINIIYMGKMIEINDCEEKIFLNVLNIIEKYLENEHIYLHALHEINNFDDLSRIKINKDFLYFSHSFFNHQLISELVEQEKNLPRHSTCFKPKPSFLVDHTLYQDEINARLEVDT